MNAPRPRLALAAASMSMAWSLVASAQTRSWDNYCTQGTFQACMSVDVSLLLVPRQPTDPFFGDYLTIATVSLRNLQGVLGTDVAWGLQGLTIQHLQPDPAPGFVPVSLGVTPTFLGFAHNVNVPAALIAGLWDFGYGGSGLIMRDDQPGDGAYPIAGCSALAPDEPGPYPYHLERGYFSSCGGWVTYSFLMQPVGFSDGTTVSITGYHLSAAGTVEPIRCTFDVGCVSTTPEPATLVLVATGLIGLAGLRLRSRVRREV